MGALTHSSPEEMRPRDCVPVVWRRSGWTVALPCCRKEAAAWAPLLSSCQGKGWRGAGHGPDVSEETRKCAALPRAPCNRASESNRDPPTSNIRRSTLGLRRGGRPGSALGVGLGEGDRDCRGRRRGPKRPLSPCPLRGQAAQSLPSAPATGLSSFACSFLPLSSAPRDRLADWEEARGGAGRGFRQRDRPEARSRTARTFTRGEA